MKTRQFTQIANIARGRREQVVVEGLKHIGSNVVNLIEEMDRCAEARANRASQLLYNVGREEAGKFLILIDAYRTPSTEQAALARQFRRAGSHLAKLIYAQIADYSIASQAELVSAVNSHRRELYLDGPNDYDWIFRNDLLSERENALYVDLVDNEGRLDWWPPFLPDVAGTAPRSMMIVEALLDTGLISIDGLHALQTAWTGFDPLIDSNCWEWTERTQAALHHFPDVNFSQDEIKPHAYLVGDRWPMPLVALDLEPSRITIEQLSAERSASFEEEMRSDFTYEDL